MQINLSLSRLHKQMMWALEEMLLQSDRITLFGLDSPEVTSLRLESRGVADDQSVASVASLGTVSASLRLRPRHLKASLSLEVPRCGSAHQLSDTSERLGPRRKMSDFDSNPFADPNYSNPFQDPSVTQVRNVAPAGLEEYNPFTDAKPTAPGAAPKTAAPTINTQPAIMRPTEEPPPYSQPPAQEQTQAATELLKRQEELEKKAAELDRREREMQSLSVSGRKNNWPPLPEKFPVAPCFYHDITVDIPVEFQKTVKIMYYLWMFHTVTLFTNTIGCLAWFCVDATRGVDFGLSILWFLLFTPCSFVCWYRPLYGAFRNDSSFRFFLFFFVYICQFGIYVLQCIGITGWGASGWITALTALNINVIVGILMIFIAAMFTSLAVLSLIMFKKIHAMYRTTGASFEKAQQEFATGIMSNKTVRTAAANAASSAAQASFKEQI